MHNLLKLKIVLLLASVLLVACSTNSTGYLPATCPKAPSLPDEAKQPPLPSWCSGNCTTAVSKIDEASLKRLNDLD